MHRTHGAGDGSDDWREQPVDFDTFVTSPVHLNLPPLYPRQRNAVLQLLGSDPKRIFDEPGTRETIPLAWAPVTSSNVHAVGWHERQLYIAFRNGTVYRYPDIDRDAFERVLNSKSPGRTLTAVIKPNNAARVLLTWPADALQAWSN